MAARNVTQSRTTDAGRRDGGARAYRRWTIPAASLLPPPPGLLGLSAPAQATTTISSCTDAALRSAVAAGGTVLFGVDCTDLQLSKQLTIPAGLQVDLRANGHQAVLDGRNAVRHFVVDGTLSITGLKLENGRATGAAGAPGQAGVPAATGTGGAGKAGGAGGVARGGSIRIEGDGTVTLTSVTLTANTAMGGAGGAGGA